MNTSLTQLIATPDADHFIVEGRWCIAALLENPFFQTVGIVRVKGSHESFLSDSSIPIETLSKEQISEIVGFKFHRGLIAVAKRPAKNPPIQLGNFLVTCINLADSSNLGAIVRTAAALGAEGILLPKGQGADIFSRKAIRTSSGAVFRIPIYQFKQPEEAILTLKTDDDYQTLGAALHPDSLPISQFRHLQDDQKRNLIFGSESDGLSQQWIRLCNHTFIVPMSNHMDSLNVAASAAIALYQLGPNRD